MKLLVLVRTNLYWKVIKSFYLNSTISNLLFSAYWLISCYAKPKPDKPHYLPRLVVYSCSYQTKYWVSLQHCNKLSRAVKYGGNICQSSSQFQHQIILHSFQYIKSLRSWVALKKKILCKNQYVTGNEENSK